MNLTISLLAREVFSLTLGRNRAPGDQERADSAAQVIPAHSEFGFAAPQARDIDYPESRWDATRYGHVEDAA